MSMTTYVIGIKPPDDEWKAMKKIWDACKEANVDPPDKVSDFFEGGEPDDVGVIVHLEGPIAREYTNKSQQGIEIDLTKLPKDIKILRFVNSY